MYYFLGLAVIIMCISLYVISFYEFTPNGRYLILYIPENVTTKEPLEQINNPDTIIKSFDSDSTQNLAQKWIKENAETNHKLFPKVNWVTKNTTQPYKSPTTESNDDKPSQTTYLAFNATAEISQQETSTMTPFSIPLPPPAAAEIQRMEGNITCKLPLLQPFDIGIRKAWEAEAPIDPPDCQMKYPLVFEPTLNFTIVKLQNASKWTDCCYKSVTRDFGDDYKESKNCTKISNRITEIPRDEEFISIYCNIPESQQDALSTIEDKIMIDAIPFTPLKLKHNSSQQSNSSKKVFNQSTNSHEQLNVVIFGIDAVSHMNFMRIMPELHNYLINNLSAIQMNGYVRIGDSTYPNILATLSSQTVLEAEDSCVEYKTFDKCPLIWKNYSAQGYLTSLLEDAPPISTFNYQKNGFSDPPVDYYLRPLSQLANDEIGSDLRRNANLCYGPRLAIDFLLDYMKKLAFTLNPVHQPYFQFIWSTSLTHDLLKLGKFGENSLLQALKWLHSMNYLNKTIFILMSDHGMRQGDFRDTRQGNIEENMPFLYFTFPTWFKEKYSHAISNMIENSQRLTTPFDLYETLIDFLALEQISDKEINSRDKMLQFKTSSNKTPRGISLFLQIPLKRTCEMAEIAEHFCVCHPIERLRVNHYLTIQATNFAVYTINSFNAIYPQCAYLSMSEITDAHQFFIQEENSSEAQEAIKVLFKVQPGGAEFDATVIRQNGTFNWTISDISRTNLYGNQSHCVDDTEMKKLCYCTDLLAIASESTNLKSLFDFNVIFT